MKRVMILMAGACLTFSSCNHSKQDSEPALEYIDIAEAKIDLLSAATQEGDIIDLVKSNANFTTLVRAIEAGGLEETLRGSGPYTIFAPINSAFKALPEDKISFYKNPENRSKITDLLTYHVVAGEYKAADVLKAIKGSKGKKFETNTIKGEKITIMMDGKNVVIKDAKGGKAVVIKGDFDASNGVMHAINAVLMPKE